MVSFLKLLSWWNDIKISRNIHNNQNQTHIMDLKKDELLFRDSRFIFAFILLSSLVTFLAVSYVNMY